MTTTMQSIHSSKAFSRLIRRVTAVSTTHQRLPPHPPAHHQDLAKLPNIRSFGTTRGARGHGWYINYRRGKGGRHLQGAYHDRETLEECQDWNSAVLHLGTTRVYLDVVLEPKTPATLVAEAEYGETRRVGTAYVPPLDSLTGSKHRLYIDLASTVMPESSDNFIRLCKLPKLGYKGTKLYRFERNVGLCGGDVLTNTGKTGLAADHKHAEEDRGHWLLKNAEPLRRTILHDPLALWHVPGTLTMLVQRVEEVDSRFILCTQRSMHMDGIHRAIGQLSPDSLALLQEWQGRLLTHKAGYPMSYNIIVADCGLAEDDSSSTEFYNVSNAELQEGAAA
ncbi:hypothetical protein ACA910_022143 [Epithemia clementina (nom. ined.)]